MKNLKAIILVVAVAFAAFGFMYTQQAKEGINIGDKAPDISLRDPYGKTINLSDLKGKVVLIDFWASWCGPCRRENPNLVKAYSKYKSKGFEIYSVSLDGLKKRDGSNKQKDPSGEWIQAIKADKLTWKSHVSELKGWQSSVVRQYRFNGIPFSVLIDENGIILDKNLRGVALEKTLEKHLNK